MFILNAFRVPDHFFKNKLTFPQDVRVGKIGVILALLDVLSRWLIKRYTFIAVFVEYFFRVHNKIVNSE